MLGRNTFKTKVLVKHWRHVFKICFSQKNTSLILLCLVSTRRSYILKKNLHLKATGLFMYVWPFSGYQALKLCSNERQNGFKGLKLKRCKFLQPFFTPCEHDCFCLKTLKQLRFKCLRQFLKINFFYFLKPF